MTIAPVPIRPRFEYDPTPSRKQESKTATITAVKNRGGGFVAGWKTVGRLSSFVASPPRPLDSRGYSSKEPIGRKTRWREDGIESLTGICDRNHFFSSRNDTEEGILVQRVLNVQACYTVLFVLDFFWQSRGTTSVQHLQGSFVTLGYRSAAFQ